MQRIFPNVFRTNDAIPELRQHSTFAERSFGDTHYDDDDIGNFLTDMDIDMDDFSDIGTEPTHPMLTDNRVNSDPGLSSNNKRQS